MCQASRSEIIRRFNSYLNQAEKEILHSGAGRTFERKLMLLYLVKKLATSIYKEENQYRISDLIWNERTRLAELHDSLALTELINLVYSIQFKSYANLYPA